MATQLGSALKLAEMASYAFSASLVGAGGLEVYHFRRNAGRMGTKIAGQ